MYNLFAKREANRNTHDEFLKRVAGERETKRGKLEYCQTNSFLCGENFLSQHNELLQFVVDRPRLIVFFFLQKIAREKFLVVLL